jgi:hypothetical protein
VEECPGRAFYVQYGELAHLCADWKKYHDLSPQIRMGMGKAATSEEEKEKLRGIKANNVAFKAATEVRHAAQKAALKGPKVSDAEWALIMSVTAEMPWWYAAYVRNPNKVFMADLLGLFPSGTDLAPTDYQAKENLQKDAAERLKVHAGRIGKERRGKLLLAQIFAALEVRPMKVNKVWEGVQEEAAQLLIIMRDHLGYTPADIETDMIDNYLQSLDPSKDADQAPQAPEAQDTSEEDAADDAGVDAGEALEGGADQEQRTSAPAVQGAGEPEHGQAQEGPAQEPVEQERRLNPVLAA